MNFTQAIAMLTAGKLVKGPGFLNEGEYLKLVGGDVVVMDADGEELESLVLSADVINATNYAEYVVIEDTPEIFGYYNTEKGRWMSTSNPDRLRAQGVTVKKFVAQAE